MGREGEKAVEQDARLARGRGREGELNAAAGAEVEAGRGHHAEAERGPHGGVRGLAEGFVFGVAGDADDGEGLVEEGERVAEGRAAGPELAGGGFVDDDGEGAVGFGEGRDVGAGDEGNAHGGKTAGRGGAPDDAGGAGGGEFRAVGLGRWF